jgi:hypothetical protein
MNSDIWPNFFIVGASKAGTTSLYSYLKQHPQIYMSPMKEPQYFSGLDARYGCQYFVPVVSDRDAYLALFKGAKGFRAVGEGSTTYLGFEDTADRICNRLPDARIIILLRDPIERAHSHYLMDVRDGYQTLSFYEAVVKELEDPEFGWGKAWHRYTFFYHPGVKRYLDTFGREQVLILLTEKLNSDPKAVVTTAVEFLGLDVSPITELDLTSTHNPYRAPRSRMVRIIMGSERTRRVGMKLIPMPVLRAVRDNVLFKRQDKPPPDADAVSVLREVFESDVRKLEELLGRPLPELRRSWY